MPDRSPGFVQRTALRVGSGAIGELPASAATLGVHKAGRCDRSRHPSHARGHDDPLSSAWSRIVAHPTAEPSVQSILNVVAELGAVDADGVIAVGGGSSLDTGKVRASVAGGQDQPLAGFAGPDSAGLPLITIPTTAGTGAEAGSGALLYDPEVDDKILVRRLGMAAELAIADGDMTLSLPPRLTAYTGLDALAQAILADVPATSD